MSKQTFTVELRDIDSIRPYDRNPRLNDKAVDAVAASLREGELWIAIPGYEGLYEVSSYGRIRRSSKSRMAPSGYILKPKLTWDGYLAYSLSKHRHYWHIKVHRVVALAFLGPQPFPGAHVAHGDGNRTNNRVSNLRWATPAENEADKQRHGTGRVPPGFYAVSDNYPAGTIHTSDQCRTCGGLGWIRVVTVALGPKPLSPQSAPPLGGLNPADSSPEAPQ